MDLLKKLHIKDLNPGAYKGSWHSEVKNKKCFASYNPATEKPLAEVAGCSLADYQEVRDRALLAAKDWRLVPAPKRGEIIRQIALSLREQKVKLATLVSLESGKSKQEGEGEVQEMIDMADFAVGQSRMLYGSTMHSERSEHRMYEQWHPYGVIAVISAFNFPVAVWSWNAFLAAICGNVTLWKPSSKTPLCAIALWHLCHTVLQENHCPDIFPLIIPGESEVAEALVSDPSIPLVSFTGSTAVGRQINVRVAQRLGKCLLELGGNNALIVEDSALTELVIPAIVFGALGTAGQRCTSTRRVFVQNRRFDELVAQLGSAYAAVTLGDPLDPKVLMGPLIDKAAVAGYQQAIHRIKQAGGQIVFGGRVLPGPGFFVEPTLVVGVKNDWDIVQEETFAPILYVLPYECLEEAISLQNAVPQGLSSALFTQDLSQAEQFLSAKGSDCGLANINIGTSGAEIGGAFGGEKETGGGREAGSDAWKSYMRRQTNTINWGSALPLAQGIQFQLGSPSLGR